MERGRQRVVDPEAPSERIAASADPPRDAYWFRAPGRVNLVGDHTDYNEGFVLPMAIELECVIAARERADGRVRVRSLDEGGLVDVAADGSDEPARVEPPWGRYVAGVVRSLAERRRAPVGLEGTIASSVPAGAGLSSSAALAVVTALALSHAGRLRLEPRELALACQRGEQLATGVRGGIMDQLTSAGAREGTALLIDCRSLETTPVTTPADFRVVVVHSGVRRWLAASAYEERRSACERIASSLGLRALRDATFEQVEHEPLARHVVTGDARVHEAARALAAGDLQVLGRLFDESHASLRDDYGVSTPELDALAAALRDSGAYGARLTGAGFGGCVIAVAPPHARERIAREAATRYRAATGREPTAFVLGPAAAASARPAVARPS